MFNVDRFFLSHRKDVALAAQKEGYDVTIVTNLAEFVKQIIVRKMSGTFYPQNKELSDTVEIVRAFADMAGHKVWITPIFNPLVWLGSFFLPPIPKMFADSYYVPEMSQYDFDYQIVSLEESLKTHRDSLK